MGKKAKHSKPISFDFVKSHKLFFLICAIIVVAFFVFLIVLYNINSSKIHADKTHFILADRLECTINSDAIIYDETNQCDDLLINFTFKNVSYPVLVDDEDKDIPSYDSLSEEEQNALSDEEYQRIGERDLKYKALELGTLLDVGTALNCQLVQGTNLLAEPENIERGDGKANNLEALTQRLKIGETLDATLAFKLRSQGNVNATFAYYGALQNPDGRTYDGVIGDNGYATVHFNIEGIISNELREQLGSSATNANAEEKSVHGFNFKLVDGWYVAREGSSAITLKNPAFDKATVEISYSSSDNAQQIADLTAG